MADTLGKQRAVARCYDFFQNIPPQRSGADAQINVLGPNMKNMTSSPTVISWLAMALAVSAPHATAQSLSADADGLNGWTGLDTSQVAMLAPADMPVVPSGLTQTSVDQRLFTTGPALETLHIAHTDARNGGLYFGQDLLVLRPQSAEAKVIAEIVSGDRVWPQSVPQEWRDTLVEIYEGREFKPVWLNGENWRPGLDAALYQVEMAALDGLRGSDYTNEAAYHYIAAQTAEDRAIAELTLTAVLAPYAHDMLNGRHARSPRWDMGTILSDRLSGTSVAEFMTDLIPSKIEYLRLRDHLASLRAARSDQTSIPLFSDGGFLRLGAEGPRVAELRGILTLTGDYKGPEVTGPESITFDDPLHEAVLAFQRRKGLGADGIVGGGTRRALNARDATPIALVKVNMERLRWEDRMDDENDVYVRVNIAEYRLHVRDQGAVAMDMRAIVGRTDRRTPIMSDVITNLKFSPDWTVPPTVYRKDILPALQSDPSYAARNGYTIVRGGRRVDASSINWSSAPRVTIFKAASANGPLGGVRFSMSNGIGIFLHDTNNRSYFRRAGRALSSGCVRVGDPAGLAHYLIQGEEDWSLNRVKSAMNRGRISYKNLPNGGVPVYLSYMTAYIDEEGTLRTTRDPYGEDRRLLRQFDDS